MKTRPRLPEYIERQFDTYILKTIYGFVPNYPKQKPIVLSGLQRQLERLQKTSPKLTAMCLYGYDDFILN